MLTVGVLLKSLTRSIPTVSIIKAKIPVSDLNRTPTVSIIMIHISVSDLSRTLNNKYNKEPDTSQ
jgi:hypothetical protein